MLTAAIVLAAIAAVPSAAFQQYQSDIPNGNNVQRNGVMWPAVGHNSAAGGGSRNGFGSAFANADREWTVALCMADTDGDGYTNGVELGDPDCVWTRGATPSRTTDISHPAYADSTPSFPIPTRNTTTPSGATTQSVAALAALVTAVAIVAL